MLALERDRGAECKHPPLPVSSPRASSGSDGTAATVGENPSGVQVPRAGRWPTDCPRDPRRVPFPPGASVSSVNSTVCIRLAGLQSYKRWSVDTRLVCVYFVAQQRANLLCLKISTYLLSSGQWSLSPECLGGKEPTAAFPETGRARPLRCPGLAAGPVGIAGPPPSRPHHTKGGAAWGQSQTGTLSTGWRGLWIRLSKRWLRAARMRQTLGQVTYAHRGILVPTWAGASSSSGFRSPGGRHGIPRAQPFPNSSLIWIRPLLGSHPKCQPLGGAFHAPSPAWPLHLSLFLTALPSQASLRIAWCSVHRSP